MIKWLMLKKIFDYKLLLLFFIIILSYFFTEMFIESIKKDRYSKFANNYTKNLKILIKEKQNTTNILALSLSNNLIVKEALLKKDSTLIDIISYSNVLRRNSDFKNAWFQIIDKDGISFKRSWTNKKGDSLLKVRNDLNIMLKEPKMMSTISTGKFDMTFKYMVPVFHENKLLGIIEAITHFNSISKN